MDVRTYTEKLENVIGIGNELRAQMRRKIETLESIVRNQKGMITQAVEAKELFRKRKDNYKKRIVNQKEKIQKLEGQIMKLQKRISVKEANHDQQR